jgi:hypothetical protein
MFARLRRDEMPLFMDVGSYFMMLGGWFEVCLCIMDCHEGLYFPLLRSEVTSRKFTTRINIGLYRVNT